MKVRTDLEPIKGRAKGRMCLKKYRYNGRINLGL